MNYEIIFGDGALDNVVTIAENLAAGEAFLEKVEQALRLLADDPFHHGIKDRSVFGFRGQTYRFQVDHEGVVFFFAARFYFRENENELMMVNVEVSL